MSLIRKFASVGGATSASRVLGFVREALIASVLGAGPVADAFYAAFRFPNLFRRLFAEGAFNSAFVPLFAKELEGNGEESAAKFAGEVFSVLFMILLVLTVLAIAFMPFLVSTVIAPAFADTPSKFELTTQLARIMFPYLIAMSLMAMLSGILNSLRDYFIAAIAPVLLNITLICVLVSSLYFEFDAASVGIALAIGVLFSGVLQLGILVLGMKKVGFSFKPRKPRMSPAIKRLLALAAPAALTGGLIQINLVVGQIIASQQDGAIALLSYADRIYQLPLGIIGIAIGVVLLPELSRALRAGDQPEALKLQNSSMEFALALILPASVALAIVPEPIVAVLFERGKFTPETTEATAAALAAFSIGLPSFVLIKVFQPAYFAREDMRTPLWFSLISLIINAGLSLLLFPTYGHVGIAFATSVSAWTTALLLGGTLWWRNDFRPSPKTLKRCLMMALSSAVMGICIYFAADYGWVLFAESGILLRVLLLLSLILIAIFVYFPMAIFTDALDREALKRSLVRRRS
ncbi:murein biosynthesis integral membrane protein MurJ [Ahrensia kielensis]|uniref:murein biosynthesis integral membrane protein MurJ n=1 Tax=Ahrensia kielensis TaxID=76980 RepID=UPI00035CB681|nr:murein biosynthesis integral membrane protein MurJ [Ahrensia kielensis]